MGTTEKIAQWLVSTRHEDIPTQGYDYVKRSLLDWIGCALAAIDRPASRILIEHMRDEGGSPQARVVGTDLRTTSADAALTNGTMGHADDFDDSAGGHPASYLTPTVLALGDELHLSGKQLLLAWALGYDVSRMIHSSLHPDRAWHTTAVFGAMGSVAAAAKLLNLDTEKTRMAFGLAASQASGVLRNFGSMTKALHPGHSARTGVVSAKLARRGFTADPDIIEARYGYADCFGGDKCYIPGITQFLGDVYFIAVSPPTIKAWPSCSANHRALTGIFNLLKKQPFKPDDIVRVEHYGHLLPGTSSLQKGTNVHGGLEGKFSLEYNIAAAFLDGKVDHETFGDERFNRGDIQAFMNKVYRYQDREAALHSVRTKSGVSGARLRVFLRDGTVHEMKLDKRTKLTGEAVLEKFRSNAGAVLSREAAERVIAVVMNLEKLVDGRELMDAITLSNVRSGKAAVT